MKPPEVTLIDLEGNPIKHKYENLSGISCRCESESVFGEVIAYELLIGTCVVFSGKAGDRELARRLCDFINDQLTFIRNGMWKTLAIYQTTLGKYWEVPIYERDSTAQHYYIPLIDGYKFEKDRLILTRVFYEDRLNLFQPSFQDFIQFYNSVFSKLTAYEGESTECY